MSAVPMLEKQAEPKQDKLSALLVIDKPFKSPTTDGTTQKAPLLQESSSYSSTAGKTIANQQYTRGKKPGSDLPTNLQRLGKEIITQLVQQEVFQALDEVI